MLEDPDLELNAFILVEIPIAPQWPPGHTATLYFTPTPFPGPSKYCSGSDVESTALIALENHVAPRSPPVQASMPCFTPYVPPPWAIKKCGGTDLELNASIGVHL